MSTVFRAAAIYIVLMVVFRVMGKRSLAQITMFDFVVLLIISETTQQAMVADDSSVTNAILAILTLLMLDLGISLMKDRVPWLERWVDSVPVIIVADGKPLKDRLRLSRVDEEDIMLAARQHHGLERMDQIKYAVLERNGDITVIPKEEAK